MNYDKRVREKGKTSLEQTHLVLIEMLRIVDYICRKNKLTYWLDAGNLLGLVRHNGFIPWDDDIDLCMLRDDYEKFIEIVHKDLPKELFFQYKSSDDKNCKWIKIRDNFSTVVTNQEKGKEIKYHQGIFIDIFPYDCIKEDFELAKIFLNRKYQRSKNPIVRKTRWLFNILSTVPVKLIGLDRLKRYYLNKFSDENPKLVATGIEIPNFFFTFDYGTVFPLSEMDFMGVKVMVPNKVHQYLTDMYGNYMKIPEEKNRVVHFAKILPFNKCNHYKALDY